MTNDRRFQPWTPEFKAYWTGPGKDLDQDPYADLTEQYVWEMYDIRPDDPILAKSLEFKRRHLDDEKRGPITWEWEKVPVETNGGHLAEMYNLEDFKRMRGS